MNGITIVFGWEITKLSFWIHCLYLVVWRHACMLVSSHGYPGMLIALFRPQWDGWWNKYCNWSHFETIARWFWVGVSWKQCWPWPRSPRNSWRGSKLWYSKIYNDVTTIRFYEEIIMLLLFRKPLVIESSCLSCVSIMILCEKPQCLIDDNDKTESAIMTGRKEINGIHLHVLMFHRK